MPFAENYSIKRKLTLLMVLVSGATLLVASAAMMVKGYVALRSSKAAQLTALSDVLASNSTAAMSFHQQATAEELLASLENRPTVEYACLYDNDGNVFASYSRQSDSETVRPPPDWVGHRFAGQGYLEIALPVTEGQESLGTVYLRATMQDLYNEFYQDVGITLVVIFASLLVAMLISGRLQRVISVPILDLATAAQRITEEGDFSIRVESHSKDEIGNLYNQFNQMLDRIQAGEEELRAERDHSAGIIRGTPAIVCGLTPDGLTNFINPAGERITGYRQQELVGRNWWATFYPDKDDTQIERLYRNIEKDDVRDYEMVLKDRDGKTHTISWNSMTRRDEGGNLIELIGFGNDITDRKRNENQLRQLRNYLKNVIDSMPSVLVGVDADGKVTQWNLEAERMAGLPTDQAQGRLLVDVFPQLATEMEKVREAIRDGQSKRDEKVTHLDDGETRFSDVTIYPLVSNGVEGAVIRVDDVTDRVRIEELMIQSEKMLSVGGLAAGMAHEINNPLAGILQNIQVVQDRTSHGLEANEKAARECGTTLDVIQAYMERRQIGPMLDAIRESGSRAAKIVDNMLSFSRKSDSEVDYHNVGDLIDQTLELAANDYDLRKKYDFRRVEIVRQYEPDLDRVPCEATKIQQVLLNLLKNGAQTMAQQEDPAEPPRFILRTQRDGRMVRIEVEDNGSGMDEATRKRVFEPFFTTKEVGVGTGLGLSVSYFIVTENHHGTMAVESTPGRGSKFIIRLPLQRNAR